MRHEFIIVINILRYGYHKLSYQLLGECQSNITSSVATLSNGSTFIDYWRIYRNDSELSPRAGWLSSQAKMKLMRVGLEPTPLSRPGNSVKITLTWRHNQLGHLTY